MWEYVRFEKKTLKTNKNSVITTNLGNIMGPKLV